MDLRGRRAAEGTGQRAVAARSMPILAISLRRSHFPGTAKRLRLCCNSTKAWAAILHSFLRRGGELPWTTAGNGVCEGSAVTTFRTVLGSGTWEHMGNAKWQPAVPQIRPPNLIELPKRRCVIPAPEAKGKKRVRVFYLATERSVRMVKGSWPNTRQGRSSAIAAGNPGPDSPWPSVCQSLKEARQTVSAIRVAAHLDHEEFAGGCGLAHRRQTFGAL